MKQPSHLASSTRCAIETSYLLLFPFQVSSPLLLPPPPPVENRQWVQMQPSNDSPSMSCWFPQTASSPPRTEVHINIGSLLPDEMITTDENGTVYKGIWLNGYFIGTIRFKGEAAFKDLEKLLGPNFHGSVSLKFPKGSHFTGGVNKGAFSGKGLLIYPDGEKYQGGFSENLPHGSGCYTDNERVLSEGTWILGKKEGPFKITLPRGTSFTVLYKNDHLQRIINSPAKS